MTDNPAFRRYLAHDSEFLRRCETCGVMFRPQWRTLHTQKICTVCPLPVPARRFLVVKPTAPHHSAARITSAADGDSSYCPACGDCFETCTGFSGFCCSECAAENS